MIAGMKAIAAALDAAADEVPQPDGEESYADGGNPSDEPEAKPASDWSPPA